MTGAPARDLDAGTLIAALRNIVGNRHLLTAARATRRFRAGFRFGEGDALAVARPGSLVELWHIVQACGDADAVVIMQAANTGLTGGSTPSGNDYDRPVVVVNTMRLATIHVIDGGRQVICLPGATLDQLERALAPYGREPHSVIGSSCIGASVMGGVCNNSGGALIQRGPAFTQMALYARLSTEGALELVNHLGVRLGDRPAEMLDRLDKGPFDENDVEQMPDRHGSDHEYVAQIRCVDADTPARYNADPRCLFEASGSAGRMVLFAVRLDTFAKNETTRTFYIGTNRPDELADLRRHMLADFRNLPVSGEYMHRTAFDIAERYGKDSFLAILLLGTRRLPRLFAARARVDRAAESLGLRVGFTDRWLQRLASLFPKHLPPRLYEFRDRFEHHLMLKMAGEGIDEAAAHLAAIFPSARGDYFACTEQEGAHAFLHRFACAGAAIRYRAVHRAEVADIISLDIALRRNERDWVEQLPGDIAEPIIHALYYGHFFCHVFHQDYLVRAGTDAHALEQRMLPLLDARGAEYPAEHNVGHLYRAKPVLADFYRSLDPRNMFNPGIGQTSKNADWR
jgi:D-lactate dehydrogenase